VVIEAQTSTLPALYNQVMGFPVAQSIEQTHFAPTCCLVIQAALCEKVGVFDAALVSGGDVEFGNRVFQQGIPLHYAHDIVLCHPARNSLRSLRKKYVRIGRGECQIVQRYSHRITHHQRNLLRRLLPPSPAAFHRKLKTRLENKPLHLGKSQVMALYFVDWYVKLATTMGYLTEHFSRHDNEATRPRC
jgi:GT2 family glycosyltransferase